MPDSQPKKSILRLIRDGLHYLLHITCSLLSLLCKHIGTFFINLSLKLGGM